MAGQVWVVGGTSAAVDWQVAAAAIAAVAAGRVAVVVAGPAPAAPNPLLDAQVATRTQVDAERVEGVVRQLRKRHDLVLVAAAAGFAAPLDGDGRTLAGLAGALEAPAVVVAAEGAPALDAIEALDVPVAVVMLGDGGAEGLPITPAGRIPAALPDDFAAAAQGWLDPVLRAGPPRGKRAKIRSRGREALALTAFAVTLVLLCWGLAFLFSEEPRPMLPG